MDPQATLERFLEACDDFNGGRSEVDLITAKADALEALDDLRQWIARDGFLTDRKKIKQ
jgi:hypothetical protein